MPTLLALDRLLTRHSSVAFGRYELLGRLGVGGMAEVFVARCGDLPEMQSLLAVKRILPHLADDEGFVSLFRREAQISLLLRHRAIARVFEVGRVGTAWFLAMELVPGESLAHLRRAENELKNAADPRLVAWVGAEIASALHHAHALTDGVAPLEVIHRDVSPQNLLLGFDGVPKLIDFGISSSPEGARSARALRETQQQVDCQTTLTDVFVRHLRTNRPNCRAHIVLPDPTSDHQAIDRSAELG